MGRKGCCALTMAIKEATNMNSTQIKLLPIDHYLVEKAAKTIREYYEENKMSPKIPKGQIQKKYWKYYEAAHKYFPDKMKSRSFWKQ